MAYGSWLMAFSYHAPMSHPPLWTEAASFAAQLHQGQFRNDGRTPYVSHPVRVALVVATTFGCTDEAVLAAALLHDVLEDTTADHDDLLERFGERVAGLVSTLSKDDRLVERQREAEYDRRLSDGPWEARLIKLADVLDNLRDATTEEARRTLLGKAQGAVNLAADDPRLREASQIVRQAIQSTETGLAAS